MEKVKMRFISLGVLPFKIDFGKVAKLKSKIIDIEGAFEFYNLAENSQGYNWCYTDKQLYNLIPGSNTVDFTIAVVNIPLEGNFYTRRISDKKAVISLFEIGQILYNSNIPIENFLLRVAYKMGLIYKAFQGKIPQTVYNLAHDPTKGCLFDMNGVKSDIIHSCHNPILCDDCFSDFSKKGVSFSYLNCLKSEIKVIRKDTYQVISDFVKRYPILSLIISSVFAMIINLLSEYLAKIFF